MLDALYRKRQQQAMKSLLKYSKYMMNDHFLVVLIILLAMLSLEYHKFLSALIVTPYVKQLIALGLSLVLSGVVLFGRIATYIVEADGHYLSLLQQKWYPYLRKCLRTAQVVFMLPSILVMIIFSPLLSKIGEQHWMVMTATLVLLKQYDLVVQFLNWQRRSKIQSYWIYLLAFSTLYLFFITDYDTLLLSLLGILYVVLYYVSYKQAECLDFDYLIKMEQKRMHAVYHFMQLFVDVPTFKVSVKRKPYFNFLLRETTDVYRYYYERLFIRLDSFIGIYFRLMCVAIVLQFIVTNTIMYICIIYLVSFLTLIQLLPLYQSGSHNVLFRLLPQSKTTQKKQFIQVLQRVLVIQILCIYTGAVSLLFNLDGLLALVGYFVCIFSILPLYVQKKIDKM